MVSEKDKVITAANMYTKKVTQAKNACIAAINGMISPIVDVNTSWQGVSGAAMDQSLDEIRMRLIDVRVRLEMLEASMQSRAYFISNNWVDEE